MGRHLGCDELSQQEGEGEGGDFLPSAPLLVLTAANSFRPASFFPAQLSLICEARFMCLLLISHKRKFVFHLLFAFLHLLTSLLSSAAVNSLTAIEEIAKSPIFIIFIYMYTIM